MSTTRASLLWMMSDYLTLACLDLTPNTRFCQWIDTDHRFWNCYFKILKEKTYIAFKNIAFFPCGLASCPQAVSSFWPLLENSYKGEDFLKTFQKCLQWLCIQETRVLASWLFVWYLLLCATFAYATGQLQINGRHKKVPAWTFLAGLIFISCPTKTTDVRWHLLVFY